MHIKGKIVHVAWSPNHCQVSCYPLYTNIFFHKIVLPGLSKIPYQILIKYNVLIFNFLLILFSGAEKNQERSLVNTLFRDIHKNYVKGEHWRSFSKAGD